MQQVAVANANLTQAKAAKNDEFYTQYGDIEKEMNAYLEFDPDVLRGKTVLLPCDDPEWSNFTRYFAQNFERLGLKKLVSTSYASDSKRVKEGQQPTLFETESPQFDPAKAVTRGKIFTVTGDVSGDGRIDWKDVQWDYLDGDGDFRSVEVTALRDEADVVVTNPPFSLFRGFLAWIAEANKKFLILGNMNAITYKEVFPLIKDDQMWLGVSKGAREFTLPGGGSQTLGNTTWFTNLDHCRRHEPLQLMTEADNIRFSRRKVVKGVGYKKYDNYDAIEVPFVDAVPSDYGGVMGVPISFLDKYCPEQFEILGYPDEKEGPGQWVPFIDGTAKYARILIKHKRSGDED